MKLLDEKEEKEKCNELKQTQESAIRYGVIFRCGEKYLVVQQKDKPHYFGFVKGCQEEGENDFNCAIREVKEEIGIDLDINLLKNARRFTTKQNPLLRDRCYHFFLIRAETEFECFVDHKEIQCYLWLTLEELQTSKYKKGCFTSNIIQQLLHTRNHRIEI